MKIIRTMADLKSDPRISEVNDERRDGMGLWAYANDRDGYFIEGGSDTGSYVQIHEDSLREVLKQANRIKHISEFSESEKENLRRWAESNRYNLKENPMRSSKASAENMVLKIVGNLDFEPSESAIDRATSYVEGLLNKSGDLFKIVSDPSRMDKVRAKVIEILVVGSMAKENPKGVYMTYSAWRAAAKKAGAVRIEGDKDIAQAFDAKGRGVAEWDGAEGYIYKSAVRENPLKPRKGESSRDFVSRCMSEEKMSFPEPKQRIAVCLSKSRKRNPVYDTGSDE